MFLFKLYATGDCGGWEFDEASPYARCGFDPESGISGAVVHGAGWVIAWERGDFHDMIREYFGMSAYAYGDRDGGNNLCIDIADPEVGDKSIYRIYMMRHTTSELWERFDVRTIVGILDGKLKPRDGR